MVDCVFCNREEIQSDILWQKMSEEEKKTDEIKRRVTKEKLKRELNQ